MWEKFLFSYHSFQYYIQYYVSQYIISVKKKKRNAIIYYVNLIFWQALFRRISKFHCSSVNFQFAFFFFFKSYTADKRSLTIFSRHENVHETVLVPFEALICSKMWSNWREKKFLCEGKHTGQANSAKRFASGTTIERMKAPIINSITRARSGPGTGSKLKRVPCNYFWLRTCIGHDRGRRE